MEDKLEKQRKIIELFLLGKNTIEISQETGITEGHIRKVIKKNGYINVYKRVRRPKKDKREEVVKLYTNGMSIEETAKQTGYGAANVRVILREYKVPRRENYPFEYEKECFVCKKKYTLDKRKYKDKWMCSPECVKINALDHLIIKVSQKEKDEIIFLRKQFSTLEEIIEKTGFSITKINQVLNDANIFLSDEQNQKNAYRKKLEKNPNFMNSFRESRMKTSVEEYYLMVYKIIKESEEQKVSIFLLASRYGLNHNSVVSTVKKLGRSDLIDNHRSSGEKELGNSLEKEGVELIKGNRKLIYPLELDIYIEVKKLAIEYCGLYWHCEKNNKDHRYHKNKLDKCKNKDIRLITIFEDEWIYRKNQVLNYLRSVLGLNKNKIYARDCLVKEISKEDAAVFIEANHIQGYGRSVINFGLFHAETLVGVINGSEHHRVNSKSILILNRLCFKEDHQILGGASKLFKYLKIWAISNNYKQILSWSDNRWSEGNVYLKMGFTLKAHLKPDYSYIYKNDFTKRLPKQSFTKKILFKKGAIGLTEREMAISIGYHRIWDCGKKSWIYDLSLIP